MFALEAPVEIRERRTRSLRSELQNDPNAIGEFRKGDVVPSGFRPSSSLPRKRRIPRASTGHLRALNAAVRTGSRLDSR